MVLNASSTLLHRLLVLITLLTAVVSVPVAGACSVDSAVDSDCCCQPPQNSCCHTAATAAHCACDVPHQAPLPAPPQRLSDQTFSAASLLNCHAAAFSEATPSACLQYCSGTRNAVPAAARQLATLCRWQT